MNKKRIRQASKSVSRTRELLVKTIIDMLREETNDNGEIVITMYNNVCGDIVTEKYTAKVDNADVVFLGECMDEYDIHEFPIQTLVEINDAFIYDNWYKN